MTVSDTKARVHLAQAARERSPPTRLALSAAASVFLSLAVVPANAEISRGDLARVGVRAPALAREPLSLPFRDQDSRAVTLGGALNGAPGLLIFEDFRCRTLCGPALSIVAAGIKASGLKPGEDVRLIAIGLNPRETPADAAALRASRLADDPALLAGSSFLTGTASSIGEATHAVGYGYAYDPATDQFTHPVAAFVIARDGRLTRVLPETALSGPELRTAVRRAQRGEIGDLVDRLAVFCHDLVPLTGRYDGAIQAGLRVAGAATVLGMAAGLAALMFRRRAA